MTTMLAMHVIVPTVFKIAEFFHLGQAFVDAVALQALIDEAFRDYLDKKQQAKPRGHMMKALVESMQEYDGLYSNLANMLEMAEQIMEEDKEVLKKLSESQR